MKRFIMSLLIFWTFSALAIPCDCEVRIHTPISASHQIRPVVIKNYQLEEFSSFGQKNIQTCRQLCLAEFQKDMPAERLSALLITYSHELIEQKVVGFNCTGLTTLKYPVRVKAKLAQVGLGNVADMIKVVNLEEICF